MFSNCCNATSCLDLNESVEKHKSKPVPLDAFPYHVNNSEQPLPLTGFTPAGFAPSSPRFPQGHVTSPRLSHNHIANHRADQENRRCSSSCVAKHWADREKGHEQQRDNRPWPHSADKLVLYDAHEANSDITSFSSSGKVIPMGTLDHEDLCRRLQQIPKKLRGDSVGKFCTRGERQTEMLKLTFWPSLQKRDIEIEVNFTSRPLGMAFHVGKMPSVVISIFIGSLAGSLGVKKGMVVKSIDDEDVTQVSFERFTKLISERSSALPYLVPDRAKTLEF